jgi:hypothetical protein
MFGSPFSRFCSYRTIAIKFGWKAFLPFLFIPYNCNHVCLVDISPVSVPTVELPSCLVGSHFSRFCPLGRIAFSFGWKAFLPFLFLPYNCHQVRLEGFSPVSVPKVELRSVLVGRHFSRFCSYSRIPIFFGWKGFLPFLFLR